MGKNQSASNLTNIIKQDANGSIAFMSGSTMLMALSNTGQMSGSAPAVSAATASSADNFLVRNTLTAQTLVVQTITSSVDFVTGSTRFGSLIGNTHVFTGSMAISGGLVVSATAPELTVSATGVTLGNVITDAHNITGSVLVSGSFGLNKAVPQRQYTQVANTNGIVFTIQNAAASNEGYIVGFDASGSTYAQLSNSANSPGVYLNSSGSSYFIGGNVGIGATSPTNRLEVIGISGSTGIITPLYIQGWNATTNVGGTNTSYGGIHLSNAVDTTAVLRLLGSGHIQLATDSSGRFISFATDAFVERMRIASGGNVGIGTSSPVQPLQLGLVSVIAQDANSMYIGANFGNGTGGNYIRSQFANQIHFDSALGFINFKVAGSGTAGNAISYTTAMAITSGGNVGIGTSSPNNLLSVRGNADFGATGFSNPIQSQYGALTFPRGQIFFSNTNSQNQLYIVTNGYSNAGGVFSYRNSGQPATAIGLDGGSISFLVAGNGTADANISWTSAIGITNAGRVSFPAATAQNYGISNSTAITVSVGASATVASCSITSVGKPILINLTGDINPVGGASWCYIYIYRNGSPIGKYIIAESPSNSTNIPFALTTIDIPGAGTHTYTGYVTIGGGNPIQFGETGNGQAPTILAIELL